MGSGRKSSLFSVTARSKKPPQFCAKCWMPNAFLTFFLLESTQYTETRQMARNAKKYLEPGVQ